MIFHLHIEVEREEDGRWIAEVVDLPGIVAYGATDADARQRALALAFHELAARADRGEGLETFLDEDDADQDAREEAGLLRLAAEADAEPGESLPFNEVLRELGLTVETPRRA